MAPSGQRNVTRYDPKREKNIQVHLGEEIYVKRISAGLIRSVSNSERTEKPKDEGRMAYRLYIFDSREWFRMIVVYKDRKA